MNEFMKLLKFNMF